MKILSDDQACLVILEHAGDTFATELSWSPTHMCSFCPGSCKKPPLGFYVSSINFGSVMGIAGKGAN